MVTRSCFAFFISIGGAAFAQDHLLYLGSGLLRSSATISPGFMLNASVTNLYVSGKLEYFIEDRISVRGSALWLARTPEQRVVEQNDQLSFGPSYHFVKGRMDVGLGMEAGINFSRPARTIVRIREGNDPMRVAPSASLCANFTWAVWDYVHFFVDARYVHARYTGSHNNGTVPLDEIIVGGGLGWQFRVKK
jgi:hypothetical protein